MSTKLITEKLITKKSIKETTSHKVASTASRILKNSESSDAAKSVAASALAQAKGKKKQRESIVAKND